MNKLHCPLNPIDFYHCRWSDDLWAAAGSFSAELGCRIHDEIGLRTRTLFVFPFSREFMTKSSSLQRQSTAQIKIQWLTASSIATHFWDTFMLHLQFESNKTNSNQTTVVCSWQTWSYSSQIAHGIVWPVVLFLGLTAPKWRGRFYSPTSTNDFCH